MKISPLSFNLNNQVKNNKVKRLSPMACDSVSFSAKIPANLQAELKYRALHETKNRCDLKIAESNDVEIIKLLQELKEDTNVSPEFKTKILLQKTNGEDFNPLKTRIDNSACYSGKPAEINYQIAKALIEASPDIETTKRQLLTPVNSIPLFSADAKGAELLLSASPDRETLRAQVLAKNKYGDKAIWNADIKCRQIIWNYCDKETRKEILTDVRDIFKAFNGDKLNQMIALAEDEETILQMLQASNESGFNLFHFVGSNEDVKYLAEQLKDYPEILKKLLTQRTSGGELPMDRGFGNYNKAAALFEISPDNETRKLQLLAKPGNNGESLVGLCKKSYGDVSYYLKASPDDETLIEQLNSSVDGKQIKSSLIYPEYTEVLQTFKSVANKKKFLLGNTEETKYEGGWRRKITKPIAESIKNAYKSYYYKNGSEAEKFSNALIEIIGDDSTTEEEAIKLIELYKGCTSQTTQNYLTQLEEYFKSQIEE